MSPPSSLWGVWSGHRRAPNPFSVPTGGHLWSRPPIGRSTCSVCGCPTLPPPSRPFAERVAACGTRANVLLVTGPRVGGPPGRGGAEAARLLLDAAAAWCSRRGRRGRGGGGGGWQRRAAPPTARVPATPHRHARRWGVNKKKRRKRHGGRGARPLAPRTRSGRAAAVRRRRRGERRRSTQKARGRGTPASPRSEGGGGGENQRPRAGRHRPTPVAGARPPRTRGHTRRGGGRRGTGRVQPRGGSGSTSYPRPPLLPTVWLTRRRPSQAGGARCCHQAEGNDGGRNGSRRGGRVRTAATAAAARESTSTCGTAAQPCGR